jgi:hypothetical protein
MHSESHAVGTITKTFSAIAKAFSAFRRSTSRELRVFLVGFALIIGWLGPSIIRDVYESWASTHLSASEHLIGTLRENAAMGGTGGFVRGRTKVEVYKQFRAEINRKEVEESTGLYMDAGEGTKPEVYAQMKKDPETGEWVLFYHFGKLGGAQLTKLLLLLRCHVALGAVAVGKQKSE